jgi:hypothetical protein
VTHTDCTCCRHWRAFEQPSAYSGEGVVPYIVAKDLAPETVADLARDGFRCRLLPPMLTAGPR